MSYSILTYKIKHNKDFSLELSKARQVALYTLKTKSLSSKDVKDIKLNSVISNQILRKYSKNKKLKNVNLQKVKLIVPSQGIKFNQTKSKIKIPCLKFEFDFQQKEVLKVNQVEIDENYIFVSCQILDKQKIESKGFVGVDRNATGHIAVCAIDNKILKLGKQAYHIHEKYKNIRKTAQKKKKFKFLKKLKNKESRIIRDINHKVSRKIVNLAKEKEYGIKLENLKGINKNKKSQGKKLNSIKSNWSFYQLEQFIVYKAKLLGVEVLKINPCYTSQRCSRCGLLGTREKKSFKCLSCGHADHSDANASFNIAKAPKMNERSTIDRDMVEGYVDLTQVEMNLNEVEPQNYLNKNSKNP